jgi:hypothetical protein
MGKKREKMLKALESIDGPIIKEGVPCEVYMPFRIFTEDGGAIAYTPIHPIDGPYMFSDEEYKEVIELINDNELYELEDYYGDDCEIDIIQMVNAGCKPNTEYYRFRMDESDEPQFSEDYDKLESELFYWVFEFIDGYKPWDKMDDYELEDWYWALEENWRPGTARLSLPE